MATKQYSSAVDLDGLVASAAAFDSASSILAMQCRSEVRVGMDFKMTVPIPRLVNAAFAIELYFKALQQDATGKFLMGHHLFDLFQEIDQPTKKEIVDYYDSMLEDEKHLAWSKFFKPLPDLLKEMSNAFAEWRYSFEEPMIDLPLVELRHAKVSSRVVIRRKKAHWNEMLKPFNFFDESWTYSHHVIGQRFEFYFAGPGPNPPPPICIGPPHSV